MATKPLGYVQLTPVSSATPIGTVPAGTQYCIIVPEAQDVRFRDDGTNPTAGAGQYLEAKKPFRYDGKVDKLIFIEVTASAKVNITYYG